MITSEQILLNGKKLEAIFSTDNEFMALLKYYKLCIQFKNKNFIGLKTRLEDVVIKCSDFKSNCTIIKTLDVSKFKVKILAKVRQAFHGKEMQVVSNKRVEVIDYFKPFDQWLTENTGML